MDATVRNDARALRRRDFVRAGSVSLFGLGLADYLRAQSVANLTSGKAKAQACILLFLEGGPSHLDTWDVKSTSTFKPIGTNVAGIQVSELLPRVARHLDKLAIIRSMRTEETNHPQAIHYAMTGHRPNAAMKFASVGALVTRELGPRNNVPPHILEPQFEQDRQLEEFFGAGTLGAQFDPMVLPDASQKNFQVPDLSLPKSITSERLEDRRSLLQVVSRMYRQNMNRAEYDKMDTFEEQASKMLLTPAVRDAFDLSREPDRVKDAYGRNGFGQSVLLARRLVEAGSRFVTAAGYKYNQWDTHSNNDQGHRDVLVPPLDQALSTLLEDLAQRGLLESTIVLAMGEFGRTPQVNPNKGRDHWPHCWSLVMGGGGIRGGQVIGASDEKGAYVADRMVSMGDVFATIYKAMGIDWEKTYMTPIGRPIKIANSFDDKSGMPIPELV